MSYLPDGWVVRRVEDIFHSFSGGTPDRSNLGFWTGEIPWLSSEDIKSDKVETSSEFITREGLENSSAKLCRPGSVLVVVRSGILKHTLPVAILGKRAAINQDIKCFDSGSADLNRWLALALKSEAKQILALNREGTTVQSVKYDTLKKFELRLPPLTEQHRIVAKLEELLAKVEVCQKRLAKIPVILKRFRQSVLAAACSGRLTKDWREESLQVESNSVPLDELDEWGTSDLPGSWLSVNVGSVVDNLRYGTAAKCSYEKKGIPVLRIPNIGEGVIDHSDMKYALLREKEFEQLRLNLDDVLIIRSNGSVSLVGKSALIREPEKGFAYAGYLIRLRANKSRVLPPYLNLALSSYDVRLQIEIPARSTSGVHNINSEEVRRLRIPLPPLVEQEQIVRRVESLFKFADQIEDRYKKAQEQVNKLTQSILAKAFRGELVPTEAELARREVRDYEPASVLLERIRKSHDSAIKSRDRSQPSRKPSANYRSTDATTRAPRRR